MMKSSQKKVLSAAAAITTFALAAALWPMGRARGQETGDEHLRIADALAKQGDIEGTMIELRAALRMDPESSAAYYRVGLLLQRTGNLSGAKAALRRAVQLRPDFAEAHYELGEVLTKHDFGAAASEFRAALRSRQNYSEAQNWLGALLLESGDLKEAEAQIKAALAGNPGLAEAHLNLGLVYEKGSNPGAAVSQIREAIQLQPGLAQAHYELGKVLREQRDLEGARQNLEAALRSNPDFEEAHYQLARVLQAQGHSQAALAEFEEAKCLNQLKEKAAEAVRLSNQGLDLAAKGDFQGAAQTLRQAIRATPDFALGHYNLALVLADGGDLKNAAVELRTAIYLQPGTARIHYELGRVLQRAGERSAARAELERAVQLEPAGPKAAQYLRTLGVQEIGQGTSASNSRGASAHPFTAEGLDKLGVSLDRENTPSDAIALFLRALSLQPDFYAPRYHLASAYLELGDYHQAALEFRKVLMTRADDAHLHFQLGLCLEKSGEKAGAIEQFGMVGKTQTDFRQAQDHLKDLLREEAAH